MFHRHCEERSDAAIHLLARVVEDGLLRFARNDERFLPSTPARAIKRG
jgi:hypothetical protein